MLVKSLGFFFIILEPLDEVQGYQLMLKLITNLVEMSFITKFGDAYGIKF